MIAPTGSLDPSDRSSIERSGKFSEKLSVKLSEKLSVKLSGKLFLQNFADFSANLIFSAANLKEFCRNSGKMQIIVRTK